jgi:benzoyl-CoA reductase/2-hydroxyglutaryl-CoA dehydratase subunit BcrC/BadD/HgdB
MEIMAGSLKSLKNINEAYGRRISQLEKSRESGKKVVGTFCLYVPDEIIFAAGADRVILCGGRNDTIAAAEEYLPRNVCPLVKSSFGAIVSRSCEGSAACPHFSLVDMVVAEATCDAKKKMYELLGDYIPTYVLDLPQRPDSPEALAYFRSELEKFKAVMEKLTGNEITDKKLHDEIRRANETRQLFHRLYASRRQDPPPVKGTDVIKILQKQFFLSPEELQKTLRKACKEVEGTKPAGMHKPRIMISGCPMPGGNTKVPDIIEARGGAIVAEESCTGTRSFENLVDEGKDPMTALAERYIKIPCACMSPNDRRIDTLMGLVEQFKVEGVVYYTLQSCHGYNVERYKVQKALKKACIPMLAIETDYSDSDVEQIGIRVDAFLEMLA